MRLFLCMINLCKIISNEYKSDLRSDDHYLSSSEIRPEKQIQACRGFEPMTFAIPVQCSTNWADQAAKPSRLSPFVTRIILYRYLTLSTAKNIYIRLRAFYEHSPSQTASSFFSMPSSLFFNSVAGITSSLKALGDSSPLHICCSTQLFSLFSSWAQGITYFQLKIRRGHVVF